MRNEVVSPVLAQTRGSKARFSSTLGRLGALAALCLAASFDPTPAHATKGEPEQLIPDSLPINAERLWLGVVPTARGATYQGRARAVATTPADWGARNYTLRDHPRRRAAFDFPSVTEPFIIEPSAPGELLPDGAAGQAPSGMTIAVWYKKTYPYDGAGIYPVWGLGKKGAPESWRIALVLKNGVPVVSLRHRDFELFDAQSVPHEVNSPRVDDGEWHHIVLRITRESCTPGRCPSVVDVGYPEQPARFSLYVDGQWRGDEVANAPLGLSRLLLGELPTTKTYDQPNFRSSPSRLQSWAFMDDVFLFDAPLSDFEIVKLHEWSKVGYMAQYPLAPKDTLLVGKPGRNEQRVQVGAASVPPSDLFAVTAPDPTFAVKETGEFPDGTTTFAWLRSDTYGQSLTFSSGRTRILVAQGEGGFSALCGTNFAVASGPFARDPRGRFQLLAMTRLGTTTTLYQDGVKVLTLNCPEGTASESAVGLELSLDGMWLAWTGSFDAVLDANQIDRRAASGPRLWNGTAPGATELADLTGRGSLRLEKNNTADTLLGGLFTNDSRSAANGGVAPGRPAGVFAAADGSLHPGDGTAPFTVSFTVADKSPLPVGGSFEFYAPFRQVLARRVFFQSGAFPSYLENTSVAFQCTYGNPPSIFNRSCVLDVVVGVGPGKPGRRFHVNYSGFGSAPTHVAIAYGEPRVIPPSSWNPAGASVTRLEPIVVIDGRMLNQRNQGDYNPITDRGEVPALPAAAPTARARWVFGPAADGGFARTLAASSLPAPSTDPAQNLRNLLARDPAAAAWVIELTDMRVYSHVHRDIEALGLDRTARCAEAGRAAVAATGPFHGNYCGGCIGANFLIAGATEATRECRPQFTYGDACAVSAECEGGAACWKGSCLTTVKSCTGDGCISCDQECGQLGRVCVSEGSSWRCGGCKGGLTPNAGSQATADSWELGCSWQPTRSGGEECVSDGECVSGWCVPGARGSVGLEVTASEVSTFSQIPGPGSGGCGTGYCERYVKSYQTSLSDVEWSRATQCAEAPEIATALCKRELALVETRKVTTPNGETRDATRCLDGFDGQCEGFAERRWRVLDPQLCRSALTEAKEVHLGGCSRSFKASAAGCRTNDNTRVEDSDRRKAMFHHDPATFDQRVLKRAFLGDNTPWVSRDYARLIEVGVGPRLIEYAGASLEKKREMQNAFGKFIPLKQCAENLRSPGGPTDPSAYTIENGNRIACEPKLQPNGATCPPPGSEGSGRGAWEFCESSFCDERGTNTCTDGGTQRQEAEGDGGNKKREGKESVKFGVVRVDDTRIEVVKDPASNMQDSTPGYTANLSQVHVPCVLGTKFPPVDLLNISAFIDKSQPTCGESKFDLQVMGFTLNPPPPEPILGSCTGVEQSGSGSTICSTVGQCTAPSLENLKNVLSWAKLGALGLPPLPTFEYCLPLGNTGRKLPKKTKTFLAGPVPITISIGLTLDPCITASFGFADQGGGVLGTSQKGLPQLEVTPSLGIGIEAKAGVGAEEDNPIPPPAPGGAAAAAAAKAAGGKAGGGDTIGASAGVKLALTIVELRFPIRWGLRLEDVRKNGAVVPGLFRLEMFSSISMALEFLSGWMGLYVTLSVGVFGIDWTLKIFGWTGINSQIPIASGGFPLYTIDFRAALAAALAGQQVPAKAACDGNQCER